MASTTGAPLVAVLDMGASAIRLAIAEIAPGEPIRILEEAVRGVLLGRDAFSTGAIRARDRRRRARRARRLPHDHRRLRRRDRSRAVATSAVREARNGDMFLDRIRRRTGIAFEIINEAEESRLVFLAVRDALGRHTGVHAAPGRCSPRSAAAAPSLTLLRRGEPNRSGVYALGSVRMRQQLDLQRHSHEVQVSLLKRYIANVIEEIRRRDPARPRHAHDRDRRRRPIRRVADPRRRRRTPAREIPRDEFLAFCDEVERLDEEALVERFRLPAVEAETLVPALLVYRALLAETAARTARGVGRVAARRGAARPRRAGGRPASAEDFERQVLASADVARPALPLRSRARPARRQPGDAAVRRAARGARARRSRAAAAPGRGAAPRHRRLRQPARPPQALAVHPRRRRRSSGCRTTRRRWSRTSRATTAAACRRRATCPYVALDRQDRLIVNKLAAILRVANALDAEHAQKVRDVRLVRRDETVDARARRQRRPDDGAAGGDGAGGHVRRRRSAASC